MRILEDAYGLELNWLKKHADVKLLPWFWVILPLMGGIWAAERWPWAVEEAQLLAYGFMGCLGLAWLGLGLSLGQSPWGRRLGLACSLVLAFALGMFLMRKAPEPLPPLDQRCAIEARMLGWSKLATRQAELRLEAWRCQGEQQKLEEGTGLRFRVKLEADEDLSLGERVRLRGRFRRAESQRVPGGFDMSQWMRRAGFPVLWQRERLQGKAGALFPLERLTPGEQTLKAWLVERRLKTFAQLSKVSPYGLLPALAMGEGSGLDGEARESFAKLGIAHILAVSGLHFGLIALAVHQFLNLLIARSPLGMRRYSRQRLALLLSLPFLGAYVAFVGAPISAQRAFLMMGIGAFGQLLYRRPNKSRAIALAALLILLKDPRAMFSLAFQLSFAAVLGLVASMALWDAPLRAYLQGRIAQSFLRKLSYTTLSLILISLATTISCAPLLIWHFKQLPLTGLLANLYAIPYVSFILLPLAMAATVLAELPYLGSLILQWAALLEELLVRVTLLVEAGLPLSHVTLAPRPLLLCSLSFLGFFFLWPGYRQLKLRAGLALLLLATLLLFGLKPRLESGPRGLRLTAIDVGQADATLIELPSGHCFLIDAGLPLGRESKEAQRHILPYLAWLGIRRLDWLVLTHPDYDHYAAAPELLEKLDIGELWVGGEASRDPAYQAILARAAARGIPVRHADQLPKRQRLGAVELQKLWPPEEGAAGLPDNEQSLVLRFQMDDFAVILMGDAGHYVERQILARWPESLKSQVLKAGHHGSKHSSSEAWLDAVQAPLTLLSLGKNNRYHFPHEALLWRLLRRKTRILRTDGDASYRLEYFEGRLLVQSLH